MEDSVYKFLEQQEGRKLKSYLDTAGRWTIGVGNTMYKTGKRVGPGETITNAQADDLRNWEVNNKAKVINGLIGNVYLNDKQMVALISFTYNEGVGALAGSSLLKTIKKNPNDKNIVPLNSVTDSSVKAWMKKNKWKEVNIIQMYFMVWNKITNPKTGAKEFSEALIQRRIREATLYFSK